ncbi:MAG: DNA polymerase III subunit gamma/tau [Pseudomonadota bacterium]
MKDAEGDAPIAGDAAYAVLARKYRPQDFSGLIGQDALVRVLTNAFERGAIPHAILLTGVRGVGKTTTARIIAKGLNCSASDGPTVAPCLECDNCVAIAESRHVDVLEMDAASRTGIEDIREIIESVRYRANMGRYKVYIIDEVHMLSRNAFNGLLKTLEEPPPHVKFILATTDAHKLPATVLSRCMRFDLRRVDTAQMTSHLGALCEKEGVTAEPEALSLVARASEGSVRDALSILDQAIAHGAGAVSAEAVREMLGLADAGRAFDLLKLILAGKPADALAELGGLHADGAEPAAILSELGSACHLATVAKAAPHRAEDPSLSPAERAASAEVAERTSMRALARLWQMLLKALEETQRAPAPLAAAEMAVIRMCHVSELPSPEEALAKLKELDAGGGAAGAGAAKGASGAASAGTAPQGGGAPNAAASSRTGAATSFSAPRERPLGGAGAATAALRQTDIAPAPPKSVTAPNIDPSPAPAPKRAPAPASPESFDEIIALIRSKRDVKLLLDVERFVRPGPVEPCSFELTLVEGAPEPLVGVLRDRLSKWTSAVWRVTAVDGHDGPTLAELQKGDEEARREVALADPLVRSVLDAFPGARLLDVREPGAPASAHNPQTVEDAADDDTLLAPYDDIDLVPDPFGEEGYAPDPDEESDLD